MTGFGAEFAKMSGKQTALKLALFEAYFSDRKDVSDRTILTEAAQSVGFDADEALAAMDDGEAREQVSERKIQWKNLGVSSVPTVVINHSRAMTGAQPVEAYKQMLTQLLSLA